MITYPLNNILYSAEDAELFHVTRTSGVYAENSFSYSLSGGNNIEIGKGIAWIKNSEFAGKVVASKSPITVDMGITDAIYPRIDAIVLQFNAATNDTTLIVKNGAPASSPVAPEVVRTANIYELHLYHITRPAGAVSISAADVSDMRLSSEHCGIMADSITQVDTDAIYRQIEAFVANTNNELEAFEAETKQKYTDAQGDIDNLVSATQTRLNNIVADTDGKINQEITSQLTEAKESGAFKGDRGDKGDKGDKGDTGKTGPQGATGPQGPQGDDYVLTEADKLEIGQEVLNNAKAETWTFTLEDGSTVTKEVFIK